MSAKTDPHAHHKALWTAVVLQARADIESEPLDSTNYAQAVALFLNDGDWAESRTAIADQLGLHGDDLRRLGRQAVSEGRQREGIINEPIGKNAWTNSDIATLRLVPIAAQPAKRRYRPAYKTFEGRHNA